MSYEVLARKWRPRNFETMVGQEPILRMLTNALQQKRIHHAYLLTGTRGVGKTTLGRILAKCLNCETGITDKPCGTCHACQAIDAGQFLDLYEVDAASRTKVEDTRELLENVLYPPTMGRYKIYLIDEVHMLSNHSFNALLKTLEEPPEQVKFILATTDPKKLPITILSRCLQFHLKRIQPEQIAKHLEHICAAENISYEAEAFAILAKAADGSLRDALSLLDQAIAYGHGNVKKNEINNMLGNMAQDDLLPLVNALAARDGKQVFACVHQIAEHAPDFQQVLEEFISLFHQLAMAQIFPDSKENTIIELAKKFTPEEVQLYYQIALLSRRDLALTPSHKQGFEMAILRMLAFKPELATVTNPVKSSVEVIGLVSEKKPEIVLEQKIKSTNEFASAKEITSANENNIVWRDLLPQLGLTGMAYALAVNCTLTKLENNKAELALSANHQPMLNQKLKERIADALSGHFNKSIQVEIIITAEELQTPIKHQREAQEKQLSEAKQTIMQNPKVKQLLEMYDATVEVTLVGS